MSIFRAFFRWIGRLFGFRQERPISPAELQWRALLGRYRAAQIQIREAGTPDELEVAHFSYLSAQADLQWHVRQEKRERGMELRPIAESHQVYRKMLSQLNEEARTARPTALRRRRIRWRRR